MGPIFVEGWGKFGEKLWGEERSGEQVHAQQHLAADRPFITANETGSPSLPSYHNRYHQRHHLRSHCWLVPRLRGSGPRLSRECWGSGPLVGLPLTRTFGVLPRRAGLEGTAGWKRTCSQRRLEVLTALTLLTWCCTLARRWQFCCMGVYQHILGQAPSTAFMPSNQKAMQLRCRDQTVARLGLWKMSSLTIHVRKTGSVLEALCYVLQSVLSLPQD